MVEFESFVNSIRCQTLPHYLDDMSQFESFVNSIRCQTNDRKLNRRKGLRALLIR